MSVKNNLKINIHRHSEGNVMTEESTVMYSNVMDPSVGVASLKDDNRMGQRGRSMVEMLGVLAIVGVLSVGGVYGYGVAMKKHKANELLHQASIHAATVSAQIMSGKEPTTLDTFADSNLGKFALDYDPTKTTFDLAISEMDSAVCEQMEKMAGGMVREVVCGAMDANGKTTATLTYYKNLATTVAEGEKSPTGEKPDPACADVTCEDGLKCFHGECKCLTGLFICGTQCCAEGTYCAKGADITKYICAVPEDGDCTKNSDCKDAEGNVDISKYCKFSGGSDGGPAGGTCTDKGELDDTNDFTVKTLNLPGGALTVYKSSGTMNWWSASNLCQAHGKQMVTMSDLGLADSGTKTDCYFDKTQSSYATYPCICNGGSDSDCSATNAAIIGALGTSGKLWLADNDKSDSYSARTVPLSVGLVNGFSRTGRNGSTHSALCR